MRSRRRRAPPLRAPRRGRIAGAHGGAVCRSPKEAEGPLETLAWSALMGAEPAARAAAVKGMGSHELAAGERAATVVLALCRCLSTWTRASAAAVAAAGDPRLHELLVLALEDMVRAVRLAASKQLTLAAKSFAAAAGGEPWARSGAMVPRAPPPSPSLASARFSALSTRIATSGATRQRRRPRSMRLAPGTLLKGARGARGFVRAAPSRSPRRRAGRRCGGRRPPSPSISATRTSLPTRY